jgi:hypothetical protein
VLDALTVDTFAPAVGDVFVLEHGEGGPLELELREARLIDAGAPAVGADGARAPFSLLFRGPLDPVLPQQIHRLRHHALGALEIFIVPVARTAEGVDYEAIFT